MTALPADVELIHGFVNTLDLREFRLHGARLRSHDALDTPGALGEWLRDHGLLERGRVIRTDLDRALRLRTSLRDSTRQTSGTPTRLTDVGLAVSVQQGTGVTLTPSGTAVDAALTRILITAADLTARGLWPRLKMCPADDCHWIFYDQSRPARARWCSPQRCGNRNKTRTYRERRNPVGRVGQAG
ncbi:CGNR zinc finger domain-containing protein [Kribbella sp. NPDC049174]|uniref:CGNR zinc finger domain-containing protein n=1 Tax=Kribbella sp. NPDC049174 TaxID=3364112 RepID=UPI0037198103